MSPYAACHCLPAALAAGATRAELVKRRALKTSRNSISSQASSTLRGSPGGRSPWLGNVKGEERSETSYRARSMWVRRGPVGRGVPGLVHLSRAEDPRGSPSVTAER